MKPIYIPHYIPEIFSKDGFFDELMVLPWLEVKEARKEFFMSDIERTYRYGTMDYEYKSNPFKGITHALLLCLNLGNPKQPFDFNVCFLNRYDDARKALGYHADDSPEIDPNHPIAVISFGAEREIWWRKIGEKGAVPDNQKQLLQSGSLFSMPAGFQQQYVHKIPRHDRPCGTRISLTYRRYL